MTKHGLRSQAKSATSCSAVSLEGAAADILLLGFLVVASVTDLRTRRIPNVLVGAMAACWAILVLGEACALGLDAGTGRGTWLQAMGLTGSHFLAAVVLGGILFGLTYAFECLSGRFAMGGGDIKLMAAIALYLGFEGACVTLLVACLVAMLASGLLRMLGSLSLRTQGAFFGLSIPEPSRFASDDCAVPASVAAGERTLYAPGLALPFAPALTIGSLCACFLVA